MAKRFQKLKTRANCLREERLHARGHPPFASNDAPQSSGPFGAVIVRNGKIIGKGWNQVPSKNDPTAHAEIVAIRVACHRLQTFELNDCEIYISCEPCPMCLSAIYWARLKRVYYANTRSDAAEIGFDDDLIYQEVSRPIAKRKLPMKQFMRKEALAVFEEWKKKADKINY